MSRNLLLAAAALMAFSSNALAGYVYELELTGTSRTAWDRVPTPAITIPDEPVVISIDDSGLFRVTRVADADTLHYAEGISLALYLGETYAWGDGAVLSTWDREIEVAGADGGLYVPDGSVFEE